jgi:hypothetical protein
MRLTNLGIHGAGVNGGRRSAQVLDSGSLISRNGGWWMIKIASRLASKLLATVFAAEVIFAAVMLDHVGRPSRIHLHSANWISLLHFASG